MPVLGRGLLHHPAGQHTTFPDIARYVEDKVEAAYRRGDLFEKRARLMADWAKFCGSIARSGNVLNINRKPKSG